MPENPAAGDPVVRIRVIGAGHPDTAALTAGRAVWAAPRNAGALPGCRPLGGDLDAVLDEIAGLQRDAAVVASGDPGFFGIVRRLAERFGRERLDVHPVASSVSLAFARLGLPWDDAVVVSLHGRPLGDALGLVARAAKSAVLTSPDAPPGVLAPAVAAAGLSAAVFARLGAADEVSAVGGAEVLGQDWPEPNVVVCWREPGVGPVGRTWGLPDGRYAHRAGMLTRSEVRAVVLARLGPWPGAVLWDVGAGSGSVGIEAAALGAGVYSVERNPEDCGRIRDNAIGAGVALHPGAVAGTRGGNLTGAGVTLVEGEAPGALEGLPDPDLVFCGGGGPGVMGAAAVRRPRRVVATLARVDLLGAVEAALAGYTTEATLVSVSRVVPLGGGHRLEALNPVLVVSAERGDAL